jgi:hypothetical protein
MTVSQSVCLGVEPILGLLTKYYFLSEGFCLKVAVLSLWGALSDERMGLQFAVQSLNGPSRAEAVTILYCLIGGFPNPDGQVPVFISPKNRVVQLYGLVLGSLYVASYDSQGYGGGILTRLHTGNAYKEIRTGNWLRKGQRQPWPLNVEGKKLSGK